MFEHHINMHKDDPAQKMIVDAILRYGIREASMASGVHENTIRAWCKYAVTPSITLAAHVMRSIGFDLTLTPLWSYEEV